MIEYVKLVDKERKYGEKNLLQSELYLLTILGNFKKYKKLRQKELTLKVKLKNHISLVSEEIKTLSKLLPKTSISEENLVASDSLEKELNKIRNKLEKLQK